MVSPSQRWSLVALALVVLPALASARGTEDLAAVALPGPGPVSRALAPGLIEALPGSASTRSAAAADAGDGWGVRALDAGPHAGYEVAAHAIDASTAIVLHKRLLDTDPGADYAPAELVALRTTDGGAIWTETVIDGDSPDATSVIDNAIAVDGAGDAVYALYYERASGYFSDMRLNLARSADRGATWTTSTVVVGYGGDYVGVDVLDEATAVASWHGESFDEGLWVATTVDSGLSWNRTRVASGFATGYYTSAAITGASGIHASYYDGSQASVHLSSSQDAGASWTDQVVADPADRYPGIGADLADLSASTLLISYEDAASTSDVVVAASQDGGSSWTFTTLQTDDLVGWNTDVDAVGADGAVLSYWWGEAIAGPETGRARVGVTADAGSSWVVETVPEPMYVTPFLDAAAASLAAPMVAYQVWDPATEARALHVAWKGAAQPPPPAGNATVLVRVEVDLGTLGDHRHIDVPVALGAEYGGLEVKTSCAQSAGEAVLLSALHPLRSAVVACTFGRQTASLPEMVREGNHVLQVAAAGKGLFVVEITGTRVA